ncbi:MAG: histidine phosphatase family protein [Myxococcales bacterium]|nr:histidine phosphatase family protein [Myxococcales bacterium]
MHTTLFLVRHGETAWSKSRRVLGRRDLALSDVGQAQAEALATHFARIEIAEVLTSPLLRAFETAEKIAAPHRIDVARDPRLTDLQAGQWEGKSFEEINALPEFQRFLRDPQADGIPGGEPLAAARERAVASVEQALADNEMGANIVVVTHAGVVRMLLAHYLGMSVANYHRLRASPGSISILRYDSARELPRVLAVNHIDSLERLLE